MPLSKYKNKKAQSTTTCIRLINSLRSSAEFLFSPGIVKSSLVNDNFDKHGIISDINAAFTRPSVIV